METPAKIYVCVNTPPIALSCSEVPFVNKNNNFEYIKKEKVLEKLRLAWGTISKDPYECNNVFEDLINEIKLL